MIKPLEPAVLTAIVVNDEVTQLNLLSRLVEMEPLSINIGLSTPFPVNGAGLSSDRGLVTFKFWWPYFTARKRLSEAR